MTDRENFDQYHFHLIEYSCYHQTEFYDGCPRHYFAKLLSGSAVIQSRSDTLELYPGDYFYIPKSLSYRSMWTPDASSSLSLYSFGCDSLPFSDRSRYILQKFQCGKEAAEIFDKLSADLQVSFHSVSLLFDFISLISRDLTRSKYSEKSPVLISALEYIAHNEKHTVADVADHCNLSESGLFYLFRTQLGKTPVTVKNELLTARAVELLRGTDLPVEEIASRLCFASSSYFRTVLFKYTGKTPSQIRYESQL